LIPNSIVSPQVKDSRFWKPLWRHYPAAPSIVLCRVPELEYAATLNVAGKTLDHCCGDGLFALLAWSGEKILAGFDVSETSVAKAKQKTLYTQIDVRDASKRLPYPDENFDLVFNNSALEHILDLDLTLHEVSRVLSPSGIFAFNVLNHRYFEWWSLGAAWRNAYRQWQPFYHALDLMAWEKHLTDAGLKIVEVNGYFDRRAASELSWLDGVYSGAYLANRRNLLVWLNRRLPRLVNMYWMHRLGNLTWQCEPDAGAGYFIKAAKA
jgi:SAM-dependent methyltransferase